LIFARSFLFALKKPKPKKTKKPKQKKTKQKQNMAASTHVRVLAYLTDIHDKIHFLSSGGYCSWEDPDLLLRGASEELKEKVSLLVQFGLLAHEPDVIAEQNLLHLNCKPSGVDSVVVYAHYGPRLPDCKVVVVSKRVRPTTSVFLELNLGAEVNIGPPVTLALLEAYLTSAFSQEEDEEEKEEEKMWNGDRYYLRFDVGQDSPQNPSYANVYWRLIEEATEECQKTLKACPETHVRVELSYLVLQRAFFFWVPKDKWLTRVPITRSDLIAAG
jgi:hypothetical protein